MSNEEILAKVNIKPIKPKNQPDPAPDFALKAERRLRYNRSYQKFCDFVIADRNAQKG